MTQIDTFKAIGSAVAGRIVHLAGWTIAGVFVVLIALVIILATTLSHWWYLLLVPIVGFGLIAALVFLVATWLLHRMYPKHLSREQQKRLVDFSKRTVAFARERAVSLPGFGVSLASHVIMHHNLDPLTELYSTSTALYQEYNALAALLETDTPVSRG